MTDPASLALSGVGLASQAAEGLLRDRSRRRKLSGLISRDLSEQEGFEVNNRALRKWLSSPAAYDLLAPRDPSQVPHISLALRGVVMKGRQGRGVDEQECEQRADQLATRVFRLFLASLDPSFAVALFEDSLTRAPTDESPTSGIPTSTLTHLEALASSAPEVGRNLRQLLRDHRNNPAHVGELVLADHATAARWIVTAPREAWDAIGAFFAAHDLNALAAKAYEECARSVGQYLPVR